MSEGFKTIKWNLKGIKKFLNTLEEFKISQGISNMSKGFKTIKRNSKTLKEIPKASRSFKTSQGFQNISKHFKLFLKIKNASVNFK